MGQAEKVAPTRKGKSRTSALLVTSTIVELEQGRAVVLLMAQPEPQDPTRYRLEATVVPEKPLAGALRLAVEWPGGRRRARLDPHGRARLRGVSGAPLLALQSGDEQALVVRLERARDPQTDPQT